MFPRPDFFSGSMSNFAENLLYPANVEIDPTQTAIITVCEGLYSSHLSWQDLRVAVHRLSSALQNLGVKPNDRVAGFLGNHEKTVIAMLAATSIGAVWTGVSADTGTTAVLDRLVQIEPVVLFTDNASWYNGRVHKNLEKVIAISRELKHLTAVIVFETLPPSQADFDITQVVVESGGAFTYNEIIERQR